MRKLYPYDKEMLFGLGDAEFHSNKYDSAAVHFRAALAIDPEMERALQHLSWTLLRMDRYDEVLAIADRWAKTTQASEAYEYLAITRLRLGEPEAAMTILREAQGRDPDNAKLALRTALVLYAMRRPEEALVKVDEAERLAGTKDALALLEIGQMRAMVLYPYLGRYHDSFRLLNEARAASLSTFGDSSTVVSYSLAQAALGYWAHQDAKRTVAELRPLASVRKKYLSEEYWRSLATFVMLAGDSAEARSLLRAHSQDMTPARKQTMAIFDAALAGDCSGAAALFETAAKSKDFPTSSFDQLNYVIARCQVVSGDYDGAITSLRKIVERELYFADAAPMIPVAWFYLGEAYERKGDVARAVSAYEQVLALWKNGDADLPLRKEARIRVDRLAGARSM
jgi:tetratricopeptide (TPR) repeat protein